MVSRRDVVKAGAASIGLIACLIAVEFVWVKASSPEPFETRFGTHVLDFVTLPDEKIGAFVVAETNDSTAQPVRYRAGFIDLQSGRSLGEKIQLASRSQSLNRLPDGSGVLIACWDGQVVTMRPSGNEPQTETVILPTQQINRMVVLPENDRWLVNSHDLMSVSSSSRSLEWRSQFDADDSLTMEHFQGRVYCGLGSGKMVQLDAESGEVIAERQIADRAVLSIVVAPNGTSIAMVLADGQMIVGPNLQALSATDDAASDVQFAEGSWRVNITSIFKPAYSPCGRYIVTTDHDDKNQLCIFDAATGKKLNQLGLYRGAISARWSVDASTLYVWGYDGRIHSRAVQSGKEFWCVCPVKDPHAQWPVMLAESRWWQRAR